MDCRVYLSWIALFDKRISHLDATWFTTSMLLSFGIATPLIFFNYFNNDENSKANCVRESAFNIPLLLLAFLITFKLYMGTTQRTTNLKLGRDRRMNKTSMEELPEFSLSELNRFDGSREDEKIYVALNGKIFDVSEDRKQYSPRGSYKMLAGRDASRAFATLSFDAHSLRSDYDDLSDINDIQRSNLQEWESIFSQKYNIVGRMVECHGPKSLQDLSMKAISKNIVLSGESNGQGDCFESLPLPSRLKRALRNYFYEHME